MSDTAAPSCLRNVVALFHVLEKEMAWRAARGKATYGALHAYKPIVAVGAQHALEDEELVADHFRKYRHFLSLGLVEVETDRSRRCGWPARRPRCGKQTNKPPSTPHEPLITLPSTLTYPRPTPGAVCLRFLLASRPARLSRRPIRDSSRRARLRLTRRCCGF
jgi:hypothetical protein